MEKKYVLDPHRGGGDNYVDVMTMIGVTQYILFSATSRQAAAEFVAAIPETLIDAAARVALTDELHGMSWLPETVATADAEQVREKIASAISDFVSFTSP